MTTRRDTLKWVAAAGGAPLWTRLAAGAPAPAGYGADPDLARTYHAGELWPLTLSAAERASAAVLCDLVIPADASSPAASAVGVVDFLDEWLSAPIERHRADRMLVQGGLAWLDAESARRGGTPFVALDAAVQRAILDDICWLARAREEYREAATWFARLRDLVAAGFYTSPAGRADLRYVGNVPLPRFDGPPAEVLRRAGIAVDER